MPKLHEVIGRTKTKIYCQATTCQTCILAVPRTIRVDLTKVGNQATPLNYSEKETVFCTNLEQMYKHTATNLETQPTTTQHESTQKCQAAT
jgi:ABC-type transporter MlaC component